MYGCLYSGYVEGSQCMNRENFCKLAFHLYAESLIILPAILIDYRDRITKFVEEIRPAISCPL